LTSIINEFPAGSRFVVTGVSGWVGRAVTARLAAGLGADWREQVSLFGSRQGELDFGPSGGAQIRALQSMTGEDTAGAYVFHFAFLGKERLDDLGISDFVRQNCSIDDAVLSAFRQGRPKRAFVSSSGAAADALDRSKRNGYGLCKLLQEDRFLEWTAGSGDVFIGRIYNISGPFINKLQSYALSSCIIQALHSAKIELSASRLTYRSYIHIYDVIDIIFRTLTDRMAMPASPVDLCGGEVVEIGELASRIGDHLGVPRNQIHRPDVETGQRNVYLGNSIETHNLGFTYNLTFRDFSSQIRDTAEYIRLIAA
jgi:nucleoside-diphosphate-sugar epimerase